MILNLRISTKSITKLLLKIICVLLLANLLSIYLKYILGYKSAMGLIHMFDFDREFNVPALYSSSAILLAAAILWFIAVDRRKKAGKEQAIYWKMLCYVFVFLSLDELISVHEHFARINNTFSELDRFAEATSNKLWFIPYGICFIAIGAFFIRFFLKLPYTTKKSMLLAAFVFMAGAVGMELLGGIATKATGAGTILYALLYTAEELFEMIGIVLFIRALIHYIAMYSSQDSLHIYAQVVSSERSTNQLTSLSTTQTISVLPAMSENKIDG